MSRLFGIAVLVAAIVAAVGYLDDAGDRAVERGGLQWQGLARWIATSGPGDDRAYRRSTTITAGLDGQFRTAVLVNGERVRMLADTGATSVVLTRSDAARIGLWPRRDDFTVPVQTANGQTRAAPVMLDKVAIDGIRVDDVRALVIGDEALKISLLGMTFLGRLANVTMSGNTLRLVE